MVNHEANTARQPAFRKAARPANVRAERAGFWDRPDWMNLVSDMLMLLASVTIGYAAVKLVLRSPWFGLHEVVVTSSLEEVTAAQLEYAADSSLRGNFFTVDLDQARQAFEKLPWVRHAELRRRWPATVEINLEEQQAAAFWRSAESGDMRLLNRYGEIFDAATDAQLPVFSGPPESAALMLERCEKMDEQLKPLGRHIVALTLSNRMAWQLKLDDGLVIELGRDQIQAPLDARLERFVAAYPQSAERLGEKIIVADLRYPSGFAVRLAAADNKGK
ncbi:MAG TPA: cell division protein FtsQ/DivIB [Rhodocyclaceae bacterium]|nr:cell division protein FtsQ/DivIB [Rhodocyclaceae bacterium]